MNRPCSKRRPLIPKMRRRNGDRWQGLPEDRLALMGLRRAGARLRFRRLGSFTPSPVDLAPPPEALWHPLPTVLRVPLPPQDSGETESVSRDVMGTRKVASRLAQGDIGRWRHSTRRDVERRRVSPLEFHLTRDVQLQSIHDGLQDAGHVNVHAIGKAKRPQGGGEHRPYNQAVDEMVQRRARSFKPLRCRRMGGTARADFRRSFDRRP